MKKLILPVLLILTAVLFLSPKAEAQTGADCSYKNYEWESYRCFEVFNSCQKACSDKAKGSYLDEVSPADKYDACMKASDCHGKTQACRDQAWANYQACKNAGKSMEDSPKKVVQKEKTPLEKLSDMPVFIGDWFERVSLAWAGLMMQDTMVGMVRESKRAEIAMLREEEAAKDYIHTLSDEYVKDVTGYTKAELIRREPRIRDPIIQKLKQGDQSSPLGVIAGSGQIKEPGSEQFIPIRNLADKPLIVSYIDSTIKGDSDDFTLWYGWSNNSGAILSVPTGTQIQLIEAAQDDVTRTVKFIEGDLEVKLENKDPQNKFKVQTNSISIVAPRTHFWVSQNSDKNKAVVGIYEGEVQITTKDGKTTSLVPEGDKPGVIIITQKLSLLKIAIFGLVLAGVIAGVIWFIKKRAFKKKRR